MAKEPMMTKAALAALTKVDGTPEGSDMPAVIRTRLTELKLVERRAWPNEPLWRTAAGNKRVRRRRRARASSGRSSPALSPASKAAQSRDFASNQFLPSNSSDEKQTECDQRSNRGPDNFDFHLRSPSPTLRGTDLLNVGLAVLLQHDANRVEAGWRRAATQVQETTWRRGATAPTNPRHFCQQPIAVCSFS